VLALAVGLTDKVLVFLRPSMRTYLVAAGVALVVVGVARVALDARATRDTATGAREEVHGDHDDRAHRASRVGWLIIVPFVVAVVIAPGTLGSWAVSHQAGTQAVPRRHFDMEAFLRTQAVVGGAPTMRLYDFYSAADGDAAERHALGSVNVRLVGFVTIRHDRSGFDLDRFLISCCAADATLLQVHVRNLAQTPRADTWIEATLRFVPGASPAAVDIESGSPPVADVVAIHTVSAPSEPYEFIYQ
jgi:uncharacterized repeat protein (TIGR03943 family)